MAGQFTMYTDKKILDLILGAVAFSAPTIALGLSTDAAGITAAKYGGTLTEVANANAYARLAVTNNTTNFPSATGTSGVSTTSTKTNANGPFTFATPTGSWGTVNGFFV